MPGSFNLGTSGFAFDVWKGPFYPPGTRPKELLAYYATRFRSVELNATFRRDPTEASLDGWRETTPDGFVFAVKAHQRITHFRRLGDVTEALPAFLALVRKLHPKLGPILFQCPPNLRFDRELIERFLDHLPEDIRAAFEFRHPSWEEARPLLVGRASWCVSETDEARVTADDLDADPFAYLRLRRQDYAGDELTDWADRIRRTMDGGADVYCYVKHEEGAAGPILAAKLGEMVSGATDDPALPPP